MRDLATGDVQGALALVELVRCCKDPSYRTSLRPGQIELLESYGLIEGADSNGRLRVSTLMQEVIMAAHRLDKNGAPVILHISKIIEMPQ